MIGQLVGSEEMASGISKNGAMALGKAKVGFITMPEAGILIVADEHVESEAVTVTVKAVDDKASHILILA